MTAPPIPPPPTRTNYVLYGIIGVVIGLAIVVVVLLVTGGDDTIAETTATTVATSVDGSSTTAGASSTSGPTDTSTTTAGTTTSSSPFAGDASNKVAPGDPFATFAFLADIRFAQREEGFTRVVFDFEGDEIPWWAVSYSSGPFTDIGDTPIAVAGTAFLRVDLASTSYDLTGEEVRFTYEGPDRIPVDTSSVTEVVRIDDFEGVSVWIIGVEGMKPFAVGTLRDPSRVYVDIQD